MNNHSQNLAKKRIPKKDLPIFNRIFADFHAAEQQRNQAIKNRSKKMAKLLSSTEKTSVQVTPDGISIVFQSIGTDKTVYWPVSDWPELRKWLEIKIGKPI